ncbi:MAG: BTAD domain-containing putative transcriptional regulator [Actinomycetota bacterium]
MDYRILGPLEVALDGDGHTAEFKGRKPRTLLVLLLLHANENVSAEQLVDDLWGEKAPATAANTLQVYVSQLRKLVGDRLSTAGSGYSLRVEADELDVALFERLADEAAEAFARNAHGEAHELADRALALWRGQALADVQYEPFARPEILRLDELRLATVENRIEAALNLGRHDQAIGELEGLVVEHPARERFRALLMLALYRAGRQADALETYREARRYLLDELGLEPGPELRDLEQAILRQDEGLTSRPLPEGNVPIPISTRVGRDRELEEVSGALRAGNTRLLTLTGPGGAGKTRLGIEVANAIAGELPDGAFFVALETIRDPALLLPAIAQALGVRESADRPLLESIADRLTGRRVLVLLDNFEQLAESASLLMDVLQAAPGVNLLVTSRAALRLTGEKEYPVEPLQPTEAVALFVDRAQAADPGFQLTDENAEALAEICARLDGLPLALELAAARTKLLPPVAMLEQLDKRLDLLSRGPRDNPARHRALRDTVGWSYELLDPEEQRLFAHVAVFSGGCTLESAVGVCDASLDLTASLIDHSLLERVDDRLRMLETIREFALEQLADDEESDAVRRRHAEHFLKLSESEPLDGQAVWLAQIDKERDNLRAALAWSVDAGEAGLGLRLAASLWEYWWVRGQLAEGRRWLDEALERGAAESPELRASALHAAAGLATRQGDYERAAELSEQSLALWKELGDVSGTARSLLSLGTVAAEQGDQERAIELSEQAAELYSESGDRRGHALAVSNLGGIALERGDYEKAAALSEQAYGLFQMLEDSEGMAFALVNQGFAALSEQEHERALELLRKALRLLAELEFRDVIGYCFEGLAGVLALTGHPGPSVRLLGAADALRESLGVDLAPAERETHEKTAGAIRTALGEEQFSAEWRLGRELPLDQAIAYALQEEVARE